MAHKVLFSPEAEQDLIDLYEFIARHSGISRAVGYIERIEQYCRGFETAPERGTRRDHLRQGLRTVGFERRVLIAFHVDPNTVTIDRVLYGGRDVTRIFKRR